MRGPIQFVLSSLKTAGSAVRSVVSRVNFWALYAAIVATLALGRQVYQYVDSRPRLDIHLEVPFEDMKSSVFGLVSGPLNYDLTSQPTVRFTNKGTKPLTIFFRQLEWRVRLFRHSPLPLKSSATHSGWEAIRLDGGDTREWTVNLKQRPATSSVQTQNQGQNQSTPYYSNENIEVGDLTIIATTTSGKYEQKFSNLRLYVSTESPARPKGDKIPPPGANQ